jgi:Tol biopolymer transport system component
MNVLSAPPRLARPLNLSNHPNADDTYAQWSPDSQRIAFLSDREGKRHLFTVRPDGSELRQICQSHVSDRGYYYWSPDGSKICFVAGEPAWLDFGRSPEERLAVVNADGTGERVLADLPGWPERARWSPDSTQIAFEHKDPQTIFRPQGTEGNYHLYTVQADGSKLTRVCDEKATEGGSRPCWSEDGKSLTFQAERYERDHLWNQPWLPKWGCRKQFRYRVNPDGSGLAPDQTPVVPQTLPKPAPGPWILKEDRGDYYLAKTDGGESIPLTDVPVLSATMSPDGSHILIVRSQERQRPDYGWASEIYVVPAPKN